MISRSHKTVLPGFPLGMPSVSGIFSSFPFKQPGSLFLRMSPVFISVNIEAKRIKERLPFSFFLMPKANIPIG